MGNLITGENVFIIGLVLIAIIALVLLLITIL